jgi:pyrroloquinoline quinone biosynthesis protein B
VEWCLFNASPDLRSQILLDPDLQPRGGSKRPVRATPISSIVLTSADVDCIAGLLHLREFQPLHIYAPDSIIRILTEENCVFRALQQVPDQITWHRVRQAEKFRPMTTGAGEKPVKPDSDFCCQFFSAGGDFPAYVPEEHRPGLSREEAVSGVFLESAGRRLAFIPSVTRLDDSWLSRLESCDVLLWDGTFWSDDELFRVRGAGKTASEMGHLPIGGRKGSLAALSHLRRPRKMLIHMNNTNPILDPGSAERKEVLSAGWEIAEDRMEIEL